MTHNVPKSYVIPTYRYYIILFYRLIFVLSIYILIYNVSLQYILCFIYISSPGLNNQLSNCANDIKEWLISNNLLLNTSKTTLLNLSPSPTYFPPFLIDNIVISPSPTASNLGVLFDSTISFIPHITVFTKSANYHLFRIRKIRKSITVSITKTLVNSLASHV